MREPNLSLDSFHVVPSNSRCRIAIVGFGTVGSAVARRLVGHDVGHDVGPDIGIESAAHGAPFKQLELTHICDRRADEKRRAYAGAEVAWTTRIADILSSDADIVVETVGGLEPATDWIREALLCGKSVVTANKQVIARHGAMLLTLAARQGRQLRFEAAVGGAMPIVRAISDGLAGDRILRMVGILNGTTNAVLSRMEAIGCSLQEAVANAQARGYAEADASLDLDGDDARAKLAILCALAFGLRVDPTSIAARSASAIGAAELWAARMRGGTIRQLAYADYNYARSVLTAWVAPVVVPRSSLFARTAGPQNAAIITGAYSGNVAITGAGAGGDATAVAVLSDLLAIARDRAAVVPAPLLSSPKIIAGFDAAEDLVGRLGRSEDRPLHDRRVGAGLQAGPKTGETVGAGHHAGLNHAEAV